MKINYSIKCSLFVICALFLGSSYAFKEVKMTEAEIKLLEKEKLSKQADKNLAEEVKEKFVNEKLFGKDRFGDMGLRITARKGVITISGRVDSKESVKEAVTLANSVEGVKSVNAKMVVKLIKQPPLTDDQLALNVKDKFVRDKLFGKNKFEDMGIDVTAANGMITLSGKVGSDSDVQKIIKLTKTIDGVKNVESKIVVHKE